MVASDDRAHNDGDINDNMNVLADAMTTTLATTTMMTTDEHGNAMATETVAITKPTTTLMTMAAALTKANPTAMTTLMMASICTQQRERCL